MIMMIITLCIHSHLVKLKKVVKMIKKKALKGAKATKNGKD